MKTRFAQTGSPFRLLFTSDLARFIEAEQKLWWPVVKEAGLQCLSVAALAAADRTSFFILHRARSNFRLSAR